MKKAFNKGKHVLKNFKFLVVFLVFNDEEKLIKNLFEKKKY